MHLVVLHSGASVIASTNVLPSNHHTTFHPLCRLALTGAPTSLQPSSLVQASPQQLKVSLTTPSLAAAAGPTPKQPQQELIIIDDSPQLPSAQPRVRPSTDQANDNLEDGDDEPVGTQHIRRQKRQLFESSSDSDQDTDPAVIAARMASADRQDHPAGPSGSADNADDHHQGIENVAPAHTYAEYPNDIIPDSSADVGGMPEVYEDYGNEPMFEDECDEPVDFYKDEDDAYAYADNLADVTNDMHQDDIAMEHMADDPAPDSGNHHMEESPDGGIQDPCNPGVMSDARPDVSRVPHHVGSDVDHMQAMQALFSPPHTTLSLMTKHLPHVYDSDYPLTLRINGKLGQTLSRLVFKDAEDHPLSEYAIDVELHDETASCVAVLGHNILLNAVGKLPSPAWFV